MSLLESSSSEPRGVLVRRQKTSIYTHLAAHRRGGARVQQLGDDPGMGPVRLSIQAAREHAFGCDRDAV